MEISNSPLEFDSEDVLLFRAFLQTRAGSRLIPKLLEGVPSLLEKGDVNEILVRSGKVQGFQEAARTLLSLAYPLPDVPTNTATEYPDPSDDSKWNDGQQINKPNP